MKYRLYWMCTNQNVPLQEWKEPDKKYLAMRWTATELTIYLNHLKKSFKYEDITEEMKEKEAEYSESVHCGIIY